MLLGQPDDVTVTAGDLPLDGIDIVDPTDPDLMASSVAAYANRRKLDPGRALRLMRRPLFFGAMMVATDRADAMVAGASHSTAQVIIAATSVYRR